MLETLILKIAGLLAALGIVWLFGKKLLSIVIDTCRTVQTIKKISEEHRPNGGSTMRDAIDRIEKRLIITEQRERIVLNKANLHLFECDGAGKCIWANHSFLNLVGRDFEEVSGRGWENFVHPDDRERIIDEFKIANDHLRDAEANYRIVNKETRREIRVSSHANIMLNSKNEIIGWMKEIKLVHSA